MKSIIALFVLCLIVFSCKKDKTEAFSPYIGTWELRGYSGTPISYFSPSDLAPGNGMLIKYSADTLYQYTNRQLWNKFDYYIVKDTCLKCYDIPLLMDRRYSMGEREITITGEYTFQEVKNDTLLIYNYNVINAYKNIKQYVRVADQ